MNRASVTFAIAASIAGAATLFVAPRPADAGGRTSGAGPGGVEGRETSTRIFERELPNVAGKKLVAVDVHYPPGASTPSHTHPNTAFIYAYVVSGEIESAVDGEPPRIYRAGDSWHEDPGAHHRVSRNASRTNPAKLLAIFVADSGTGQLVFPDQK